MLLFSILLAWCQVLFLQQGIKRQTWGGGGGGGGGGWGTMVFKDVNVDNKHINRHQEYIQSLMKFHLPKMLDINSVANANWLHSSLINDKRQAHK